MRVDKMSTMNLLRLATLLALLAVVLASCTGSGQPGPGPSMPPRPFTIATTTPPMVLDPALVTSSTDIEYVANFFQTLMTAQPGGTAAKPDAAKECLFESKTLYTCRLQPNMKFGNGNPLTSSDVKFSILRAIRLDPTRQRTYLLGSLDRISTPDELTVKFVLTAPDTLFVWGLAAPSAAIVDEETYDADKPANAQQQVAGSGPLTIADRGSGQLTVEPSPGYLGPRGAALREQMVVRYFPDSGSIEEAMNAHQVDAVWHGLSASALARLGRQADANNGTTDAGFRSQVVTGVLAQRLTWNSESGYRNNPAIRMIVRDRLQDDRIADSLVPRTVLGYQRSFAAGGRGPLHPPLTERVRLVLAYEPRIPGQRDLANQVRDRLESYGGLSVRLIDDASQPHDLTVATCQAQFATAISWLEDYLISPAPESAAAAWVSVYNYRLTTDPNVASTLVATMQRLAASDAVIVPISPSDLVIYVGGGFTHHDMAYGPNGQLGLWGFSR